MPVLVVSMRAKTDSEARFVEEITRNATASLTEEPGCLRFDVCRVVGDPGAYVLYEVYADDQALDHHRSTPHFQAWRGVAGTLLSEPTAVTQADLISTGG
ncbi:MAG TPA: putative quinol monooxygenase [Jatrophihabitantaceae bacterium]|jgi:autoinducer 2-degrading protein|nr:putative quinol monooxygenase [Jatrophihabitantaceae bacterium]